MNMIADINTNTLSKSQIIFDASLKENSKIKKILKVNDCIDYTNFIKILSSKFNSKIKSVGITNVINSNNITQTEYIGFDENSFELFMHEYSNISAGLNSVKIICSASVVNWDKIYSSTQSKSNPIIKIYANQSYVPTQAQTQLEDLSKLEGVKYLIGMPDLHVGKFPVGSVVVSESPLLKGSESPNIYPELVGTDIGCGMSFIKTSIQIDKFSPKQLERIANKIDIGKFDFGSDLNLNLDSNLDSNNLEQEHLTKYYSNTIYIDSNSTSNLISGPIDDTWWNNKNYESKVSEIGKNLSKKYASSMGTIGLGNHFVELLEFDTMKNQEKSFELITKYNIDSNVYWIIVHSGSRGLGEEIFNMYQSKQINLDEYLILHDYAIEWAKHNRWAIADQFRSYINCQITPILDLTHNWVERVSMNDLTQINIHRKGATPAYTGPIVIPGSRGTRTWLVEPVIQTHCLETGFSVSHGAGRKISRAKAQGCMNKKTEYDREQCCQGDKDICNIVICEDKNLFYEEAPFAYKDIQAIVDDLKYFNLAIPICSFIPKITFKCKK